MMHTARTVLRIGVWVVLLNCTRFATAQSPNVKAQGHATLLLENEHVRVREVLLTAGHSTPLLSSSNAYIHTFGVARYTALFDGEESERHGRAGQTCALPGNARALRSLEDGDHPCLLIELKAASASTQPFAVSEPAAATTTPARDAGVASPDTTRVTFEDHRIRVLENRVRPGARILEHAHCWPHVAYVMGDCRLRFRNSDGATTELTLARGATVWALPVTHEIENVGESEAALLNFEVKGVVADTSAGTRP